jgi:cobalt-zinc-cadmium efflux system membrane fusion protein
VVGAGLDPATRTLAARAAVANPSKRLKPGMLASVLIPDGKTAAGVLATSISLPAEAVQLVDGKPSVFVARPDSNGGAGSSPGRGDGPRSGTGS